ncbi:MAG TPA: hypothetical protein VFA11_05755 [Acidimicrobiales bacterium]|nr:hypothetical protein [Acidimicrobiales bacterium]
MGDWLHTVGIALAIALIATGLGLRVRARPRQTVPPESPVWDDVAEQWRQRRGGGPDHS